LCSLKDAQGVELIWQAGAAWPRHAPLLFPIVGRLKNDELRHRGKTYPMTQHGFARDQVFEWRERSAASCSLVLRDSAATRARYPVRVSAHGRLSAASGRSARDARDRQHPARKCCRRRSAPIRLSIGRCAKGVAKESYSLTFSDVEAEPVRRLKDGLMPRKARADDRFTGKTLALYGTTVRR